MHNTIRSLLPKAAAAEAFSAVEAGALVPLLPDHLLDILTLARLAASSGGSALFSCGISNAKSGRCAEDCAFCAQSSRYDTGSPAYPLADRAVLLERALALAAAGADYMGIVISGTGPSRKDFERLCRDAEHIRAASGLKLCASFGLLKGDQALALKQAGFTSYHHNLETARSHYPSICTTHKARVREETVLLAKKSGLRVCSGGIFGLGESWEQRLELALALRELDVNSIPINFLNPIKGTPLGAAAVLPAPEALAVAALLRLMHPGRDIVVCGGRTAVLGEWDAMLFAAGVNGIMTGDYLTTKGSPFARDAALLEALGLRRQR